MSQGFVNGSNIPLPLSIASGGTGSSTGDLSSLTHNGRLVSYQIFASGTGATYTKPAGVTDIIVECIGAGGGGGGVSNGGVGEAGAGGGGGAGGYCRKLFLNAAATYTYTCGVAGTGGAVGNNAGTAGTATTFDSMSAGGGAGGAGTPTSGAAGQYTGPSAGGSSSGGDINFAGGNSTPGMVCAGSGTGLAIGGGGGAVPVYGVITPYTSVYSNSSTGVNGVAGCGGGGGAVANHSAGGGAAGGNGGTGFIIVYEYA